MPQCSVRSGRLSDQRRQVQDGFATAAISEVRLNLRPFPLPATPLQLTVTAEGKGAFLERNQNGTCSAKGRRRDRVRERLRERLKESLRERVREREKKGERGRARKRQEERTQLACTCLQ